MNENVMDFYFFNVKINMLKIFIFWYLLKLMLIWCCLKYLLMYLFKFIYGLFLRLIGKVFNDIVLKFLMLVFKKIWNKNK